MTSKRKADDFIYTLSDNDDIPDEEVIEPSLSRHWLAFLPESLQLRCFRG
jgi:hypothetical protein